MSLNTLVIYEMSTAALDRISLLRTENSAWSTPKFSGLSASSRRLFATSLKTTAMKLALRSVDRLLADLASGREGLIATWASPGLKRFVAATSTKGVAAHRNTLTKLLDLLSNGKHEAIITGLKDLRSELRSSALQEP